LKQSVSPDDEHEVLEACRELQIKINTQKEICASRWSFTKNHGRIMSLKNSSDTIGSQTRDLLVCSVVP
jgi:hypothetical protein